VTVFFFPPLSPQVHPRAAIHTNVLPVRSPIPSSLPPNSREFFSPFSIMSSFYPLPIAPLLWALFDFVTRLASPYSFLSERSPPFTSTFFNFRPLFTGVHFCLPPPGSPSFLLPPVRSCVFLYFTEVFIVDHRELEVSFFSFLFLHPASENVGLP